MKLRKILTGLSSLVFAFMMMSTIQPPTQTKARTRALFTIEVDSEAKQNSLGHTVQAIYTLDIISQDFENGTITVDVGSYWKMSGYTDLYDDYFYLDGNYVGAFVSNNGTYPNGGTVYRDEKYTITIKASTYYKFTFEGKPGQDQNGNDFVGGDAKKIVILNPPSITAKDGTWLPGEVANGTRTWQSLYTDGATGSVEGNKVQTGTGFMYYDVEDAPGGVGTYDNNIVANNSGLSKIVDETRGVTYDGWAAMQDGLKQMNNSGVYRIYTYTTDSQGFRAEASRKITVNSPPTIQAIDGTWRKGDVASGLRTWQSLYTDGATGSVEGNKVQTDTGFMYFDDEEAPNGVNSYDANPVGKNSGISKIVDETRGVSYDTWDSMQNGLKQMNELGTYRIYTYTQDSHGAGATASRKVTVVPKLYKVTWKDWNGNDIKIENVEEGKSANPPSDPTRTGYQFNSWDKDYSKIVQDTIIYAEYIPNKYTIHFEGNGHTSGSTAEMKNVIYDTTVNLNANGFIRQYNVVYDPNGGTSTKQNEIAKATFVKWTNGSTTYLDKASIKNLTTKNHDVITMTANWKLAEITLPTVTKANSTFMGWYSSEGKFIGYAGTKYTPTADTKFVAKWDEVPFITAPDKTFYQGEYTKDEWINSLRMKDAVATDKEDGNITSKIKVIYDNVDVNTPGVYKVTYSVTDTAGITVKTDAKVTVLYNNPPVIDAKDQTFYENQYTQDYWEKTLRWKDVSASDVEDGNLTSKVKITYDNVDVTKPGKYKVTYSVTDSFGKTATKDVVVTVLYNNPPVINAKDQTFYENQYTKEYWEKTLRWKDVSASDVEDGNLTSKVKITYDNVDVTKPGKYKVTYSVTDSFGKTTTKDVTITVLYNNPPVINAKDQTFYENQYSKDYWQKTLRWKDVSANDIEDGDLTSKIKIITDTVDVSKPGVYKVVYIVTDSLGKMSVKEIKVTVLFNEAPVINAFDQTFYEGQYSHDEWINELRMQDVTASDKEDGNLTDRVVVTYDNVDVTTPGKYKVTYSVTDSFGKTTTKDVVITVLFNNPPTIKGEDRWFYITEDITDEMLLERVKANDVEDGDISDKVTIKYSNVVEHQEGEYKVTYEVIDQYGKSAETTVTIHIVTNIPEGSDRTQYLRYISKDYIGTLKENSVWRSGNKATMLTNTLSKTSPSQAKEHWKLTADDIDKIKQFNKTHNWSQESNQEFLREFAYLKQ